MKILVIQTAFMGDAVLATALIEELDDQLPHAELHLLVRKGNEGLFVQHPKLKKCWVWNKTKRKYLHLLQLLVSIRKEKFDTVYNLQRFAATGFLTVFSGAEKTIGFNKNPFSFLFSKSIPHQFGMHETTRNLSLIGPPKERRPQLYPLAQNEAKCQQWKSEPYITIAPASVWATKQYPIQKWIELILQYPANVNIHLIGGPADFKLCQLLIGSAKQAGSQAKLSNLCGQLNLLDTCSLMRDANMNYTNDSGPLHLASAMNAPIRAIFCSTIDQFGFGPISRDAKIIETPLQLDCRPCGVHGKTSCPKGHFNCANSIKLTAEGF